MPGTLALPMHPQLHKLKLYLCAISLQQFFCFDQMLIYIQNVLQIHVLEYEDMEQNFKCRFAGETEVSFHLDDIKCLLET